MNFDEFLSLIQKYLYRFSISTIGITDIVQIIIISAIVYQIIKWLQLTRAWTLFKGIVVLLLFALMAVIFQLDCLAAVQLAQRGNYGSDRYFSAGTAPRP